MKEVKHHPKMIKSWRTFQQMLKCATKAKTLISIHTRTSAYLLFIDLQKAYDSVDRSKMWHIFLNQLNIPMELVKALKLSYCDLEARITEDIQQILDAIPIRIGVKQGCPISPLLFCLFFDRVESYILAALKRAGRQWK